MVLVIGGAFSGRHDVANRILSLKKEKRLFSDVYDVTEKDCDEFFLEQQKILDTDSFKRNVIERISSFSVVVATEMGCGIVPLSKEEREKREKNGKLNIFLAREAAAVVLVVSGIAHVIKGRSLEKAVNAPLLALFRHGKTLSNSEKRFAGGVSDVPLSEEGEKCVFLSREALFSRTKGYQEDVRQAILNPKEIFVSPMIRAVKTAEILFPLAKKNQIEDFREMKMGLFENMTHSELVLGKYADGTQSKENATLYQSWLDSNGKNAPPSSPTFPSESLSDFLNRTALSFRKIIFDSNQIVIVFVAHGGVQMSLCSQFFFDSSKENPFRWQTENADFRFGALSL